MYANNEGFSFSDEWGICILQYVTLILRYHDRQTETPPAMHVSLEIAQKQLSSPCMQLPPLPDLIVRAMYFKKAISMPNRGIQ